MRLGLRARSALALSGCILLVLLLALLAGWYALRSMEHNLGRAFARNTTQYSKLRVLAPVERELALAQRFADSEVTRRWLADENDPARRELFFAEAERYRLAFFDRSYSIASTASNRYWFNDARSPSSQQPRYVLNPATQADAWFFNTIASPAPFNINVDADSKLGLVKVWLNLVVRDGDRVLGVASTGYDFSSFIQRLTSSAAPGVTPMLLGRDGSLQAHPDARLIAFSTANNAGARHRSIYDLLGSDAERRELGDALSRAAAAPDAIELLPVHLQGRSELLSVSYSPELNWFVATSVDLKAAQVIDGRLWLPLVIVGLALLALLTTAITLAVDRLLLTPLLKLTASARSIEQGQYAVQLPAARGDELGELTRAFGAMAERVRQHTDELEGRVLERTRELSEVNQQMAVATRKLGDSLEYAGLIQSAILPEREMTATLGDRQFVLWLPRDRVGGDFYLFRADEHGYLVGVIDCAGHGVPGALMTMVAHTAINVAIDALGLGDPAALLTQLDERIRGMLGTGHDRSQIATRMDAGLAYVDTRAQLLRYAGAKTSLYWVKDEQIGELAGDRRAIGDRRRTPFTTQQLPLHGATTLYLTSDGLLDQAGGDKGFSFGEARLRAMLLRHAEQPMDRQRQEFMRELAEFQGELPQRDDITLLGWRCG